MANLSGFSFTVRLKLILRVLICATLLHSFFLGVLSITFNKIGGCKMVCTTSLKLFCRELVRYVGTGYKFLKIVKIPTVKEKNKSDILEKVRAFYATDLTRGKRQARRLRGEANFGAIQFLNIIVILKTEGKETISKLGEFHSFEKLEINITEDCGIFLYRTNDKKISIKITRDMYVNFKSNYELSFKNNDGRKFHNLQKKWNGLPHYRGIGEQRSQLLLFLKELKKKYSKKWDLDYKK